MQALRALPAYSVQSRWYLRFAPFSDGKVAAGDYQFCACFASVRYIPQ